MTIVTTTSPIRADELATTVAERVATGARFAGLFALPAADGGHRLVAVVAWTDRLELVEASLASGATTYPALTPAVPGAAWYEREIHDLYGLVPDGHPRVDPLVLPLSDGVARPAPGFGRRTVPLEPDDAALPSHVTGEGVFTIPYGPVRSGVFESVEYLVETPGEDIPHLRTRVYHKHRGLEQRFAGMTPDDGALLAERVEGVASVAHATAFCQAVEQLAGVTVPPVGALVRTLHAELERLANHLDVVVRLTEAAGLAVGYARFSLHKEHVLRLVARLCGSRFGRGVVVPGGVTGRPRLGAAELLGALDELESAIRDDARLLMATPSFLDRVRGTGVLSPELAAAHGALGPIGRASGLVDDARVSRPYAAYGQVGFEPPRLRTAGDAQARLHVRWEEMWDAFHLARQSVDELAEQGDGPVRAAVVEPADGLALGWAEAPQGELLYLVETDAGQLRRVKPRSASFHNLALFHQVFGGDILTDFAFIEASFGLSIAGVAG